MLALTATFAVAAVALAADDDRARLEKLNVRETVLTADQAQPQPPGATADRAGPVSPRSAARPAGQSRRRPWTRFAPPSWSRRSHRSCSAGRAPTPPRLWRSPASAVWPPSPAKPSSPPKAAPPNAGPRPRRPGRRLALRPALDAPLSAPTGLSMPTPGALAHRFGETLPGGGRADGLTIAAAKGARVTAPGAGLVQYVGAVKGWGVILILRLPGGYHLVMAGLDRATVGIGQSVAAGAPVGQMPDGRQSPTELYLEVREGGAPVDPERWLRSGAQTASGN